MFFEQWSYGGFNFVDCTTVHGFSRKAIPLIHDAVREEMLPNVESVVLLEELKIMAFGSGCFWLDKWFFSLEVVYFMNDLESLYQVCSKPSYF